MKTLLVTGALGYIGSHFCIEATNQKYNIIAIDNLDNSYINNIDIINKLSLSNIKFIKCDIRNYNDMKKIFIDNDIFCVIHFAALKSVSESYENPLLYYDVNVNGTLNILKVMNEMNCKKIIFSSSACIYGNIKKKIIKEDDDLQPINVYGTTKLIGENMLKDLVLSDNTWKVFILRYFNVVGAHPSGLIGDNPKKKNNTLFPSLFKYLNNDTKIFNIFGGNYDTKDGTCIRDYIHVMDLITAHMKCLNKIETISGNKIYNLGCGIGTSVLEIIKNIEKISKKKIKFKITSPRIGDTEVSITDTSLAGNELEWIPSYNINDICKHSIKFWKTL